MVVESAPPSRFWRYHAEGRSDCLSTVEAMAALLAEAAAARGATFDPAGLLTLFDRQVPRKRKNVFGIPNPLVRVFKIILSLK